MTSNSREGGTPRTDAEVAKTAIYPVAFPRDNGVIMGQAQEFKVSIPIPTVSAEFARSLELALGRRDRLLRGVLNVIDPHSELAAMIERELGG